MNTQQTQDAIFIQRPEGIATADLPDQDYPNAFALEDAQIRWRFPRWMRWTVGIGMVWYLGEVLAEAIPWAVKAWLR